MDQQQLKKLANNIEETDIEEFKQEGNLMALLHHSNIVQFFGGCFEKDHYALVMEYMPNGSLATFLHSKLGIEWNIRYQIGIDVGSGMSYLHANGIIQCRFKKS